MLPGKKYAPADFLAIALRYKGLIAVCPLVAGDSANKNYQAVIMPMRI